MDNPNQSIEVTDDTSETIGLKDSIISTKETKSMLGPQEADEFIQYQLGNCIDSLNRKVTYVSGGCVLAGGIQMFISEYTGRYIPNVNILIGCFALCCLELVILITSSLVDTFRSHKTRVATLVSLRKCIPWLLLKRLPKLQPNSTSEYEIPGLGNNYYTRINCYHSIFCVFVFAEYRQAINNIEQLSDSFVSAAGYMVLVPVALVIVNLTIWSRRDTRKLDTHLALMHIKKNPKILGKNSEKHAQYLYDKSLV